MKKMLLATALALLITGCAQQTFVQNKPAAVAPRKPSPIISSFLELGEENCRCSKICGGAENVVKTETQQTFVNGLLRFYYFRHLYSAGSACVVYNNCMSCPSIWATLSTLLINILLGSFQLFLHLVISLSLRVK